MAAAGGDDYWWATLDILAGREEKRTRKDILDDVDEWLTKITAKINKQRRIALNQPAKLLPTKPLEKENENEKVIEEEPAVIAVVVPKLVTKVSKLEVSAKAEEGPVELPYYESALGDQIEIECTFKDPRIRSRLERLMGSNVVRIMDRKYMTKLQERLKEDHLENLTKRIQEREAQEVEREKKLILEGKIPIEEAPKELKDHPVCKINQITKKILEEKKAKSKNQSKISAYKTSLKKPKEGAEKAKHDDSPSKADEEKEEKEDEEKLEDEVEEKEEELGTEHNGGEERKDSLFGKEEYDKLKYEDPLVKVMKEAGNVEEMYKLAEKIVGPLKHTRKSK